MLQKILRCAECEMCFIHSKAKREIILGDYRQGQNVKGYGGESPLNPRNLPFCRVKTAVQCILQGDLLDLSLQPEHILAI